MPEVKPECCTKEGIADVFSYFSEMGFILKFESTIANKCGDNVCCFTDKKHWLEIINHAIKSNRFYDSDCVKGLLEKRQVKENNITKLSNNRDAARRRHLQATIQNNRFKASFS
jgi:hypothetical protein